MKKYFLFAVLIAFSQPSSGRSLATALKDYLKKPGSRGSINSHTFDRMQSFETRFAKGNQHTVVSEKDFRGLYDPDYHFSGSVETIKNQPDGSIVYSSYKPERFDYESAGGHKSFGSTFGVSRMYRVGENEINIAQRHEVTQIKNEIVRIQNFERITGKHGYSLVQLDGKRALNINAGKGEIDHALKYTLPDDVPGEIVGFHFMSLTPRSFSVRVTADGENFVEYKYFVQSDEKVANSLVLTPKDVVKLTPEQVAKIGFKGASMKVLSAASPASSARAKRGVTIENKSWLNDR